ncbi:hypothetical protein Zmor_019447 [Zophobas morio]|uniref:Uncharacterized protein n=1 Tax=Zophobas morio TaxID=2755281 RepID=A0AA38I3K5_9CUCU|nr:hypothetical protein Zmor_019447 [Zophobas morio]
MTLCCEACRQWRNEGFSAGGTGFCITTFRCCQEWRQNCRPANFNCARARPWNSPHMTRDICSCLISASPMLPLRRQLFNNHQATSRHRAVP